MFTNTENFERWLTEKAKDYCGNIQDYLNDLEHQNMITGTRIYELSRFETKSGKPECYSYSINYDLS